MKLILCQYVFLIKFVKRTENRLENYLIFSVKHINCYDLLQFHYLLHNDVVKQLLS